VIAGYWHSLKPLNGYGALTKLDLCQNVGGALRQQLLGDLNAQLMRI
jgi:hypothetical protein